MAQTILNICLVFSFLLYLLEYSMENIKLWSKMNWKIWYSSVYRIYHIILNIYWQVLTCVKIFQAKMKLENIEMEFLTHAPSEEQNLRAERLISSTCLIYRRPRRPRLISWRMNVCQESFWILQQVDLLLQVWLGYPLLHSLPL